MSLINSIVNLINYNRLTQIDFFRKNPVEVQGEVFKNLIRTAQNTEIGKQYNFSSITSQNQFAERMPVFDYDSLKPYIERVMKGQQNVIWPSEIKWFAKSSGTTSDRSKFIPISNESLED